MARLEITVCGFGEAKRLVSLKPGQFNAVISIDSVGNRNFPFVPPDMQDKQLCLNLDDYRPHRSASDRPPSKETLQKAFDFARTTWGGRENTHILVNCQAGISRSTALALAIASDFADKGSETKVVEALFSEQPAAIPNQAIIKLADQMLERQDSLIAAVNEALARQKQREAEEGLLYVRDSVVFSAESAQKAPVKDL